MKKKSIKTHILVPTLLVLALGLGVQAWFISRQSTALAGETSRQVLDEAAARYAAELQTANAEAMGALRAYAPMLLQAGNNADRDSVISLMRSYVSSEAHVLGMWAMFQPDAFDGRDAEHIGDNYHDASGSFQPFIFKVNGGVTADALSTHVKPGHTSAAENGEAIVSDPYYSSLTGKRMLVYSISLPIVKNGEAIGVLGIDLDLQAVTAALNTPVLNQGYIFTVSANGLIATHPDRDMIMTAYADGWDEGFTGEMGQVLTGGAPAFIQGVPNDVQEQMAISVVSVPAGNGSWAVCAAAPHEAMLAPAAPFGWSVWVVSIVVFLLVLVTLVVTSERALHELRRLTVIAGAIANGKFLAVNMQTSKSDGITYNESELLRRSLASMANGMKRQHKAIKRMAAGDMTVDIRPRTPEDAMNVALRDLARKGNGLLSHMSERVQGLNQGMGELNDDVAALAEQSRQGTQLAERLVRTATAKVAANNAAQIETVQCAPPLSDSLDKIAGQCKDMALQLSQQAGRNKGRNKRWLGLLAVQAKDLFDLCNTTAQAAQQEESVVLPAPITGDGVANLKRLAENLRRLTGAVDSQQAEEAAHLAEKLAAETDELGGIICAFKLKPLPGSGGKKLGLAKRRQEHTVVMPAERPAFKSAASAGG